MFEDFQKTDSAPEGRGRMGASVVISALIFGGIISVLAAAIATAHVVVKKRQADVAVQFADLPRAPKPRPAVAKAKAVVAKRTSRPQISAAPKEIPKERPEEADGDLAVADNVGPVDGLVTEKAPPPAPAAPAPLPPAPVALAPAGPPPEQEREAIVKPAFVSGCRAPDVPDSLQSVAATVAVDVRMLIGANGKVVSAEIVKKSHDLVPDEIVLRCVREQVFEPAHLPDGTKVVFPYHRRFVFRPAGV